MYNENGGLSLLKKNNNNCKVLHSNLSSSCLSSSRHPITGAACQTLPAQNYNVTLLSNTWASESPIYGWVTSTGWQQTLQWRCFHLLVPSCFFPHRSLCMWLFYLCLYYWKRTRRSRQPSTSETAMCKHYELLMRRLRNADICTVFLLRWTVGAADRGGKGRNEPGCFHLDYLKWSLVLLCSRCKYTNIYTTKLFLLCSSLRRVFKGTMCRFWPQV